MQHQADYSAFMLSLHHQLFGLLVYSMLLVAIVAFSVPTIRRMRRAGDIAGANRRAGVTLGLIAAAIAIFVPLIATLR